jgi:inhibitor of cysteine peptidase
MITVFFSFPAVAAQKTVTQDDNGKSVTLNIGDKLIINLKGNYTTGYQWTLKDGFDNDVIVQVGEASYKPEKTDRVGSGGIATFTFKAVGKGRTDLMLEYLRSWEKNVAPAEDFELTVVVKNKKGKKNKTTSEE